MKRSLVALIPLLLASSGCSTHNNSAYAQFYQVGRQSVAGMFGNMRVKREQAAAIPYASLGYTLNGGNENILVLATSTNGEDLWTADSHVVLLTQNGRVVRTVGLPNDLGGTQVRNGASLPSPAAAVAGPFSSTRLEDFPKLGLYGVSLSCEARAQGRMAIEILGQPVDTIRIQEACRSSIPGWSFADTYWVDAKSGYVWRSNQHISPKKDRLDIEVFRRPG